MSSTIDENEVKKFSAIADEWWDEGGKFKPLHEFNPCRVSYIGEKIIEHFSLDQKSSTPFSALKILDIGCGGGLVAEPFARMKANVTGIDASAKNISVAEIHAAKSDLKINYQVTSAENFAITNNGEFDVVFALEIVEHVADVDEFMRACSALLKPGGILFVATLNRTIKSFLFAKIGAEYVLRWLPRGIHSWDKFLKPSEVSAYAAKHGANLKELCGFNYNLLQSEWRANKNDLDVNYIAVFTKK